MVRYTRIGGGLISNQSQRAKKSPKKWWTRAETLDARHRKLQWLSLAACGIAGLISKSALGASGSWTGTTNATWAGNNWSATPVPGTGDTATFNGAGNGNTTIDLGSGVTINNILFNTSSAAAYTIGTGGANSQALTLNDGGSITMSQTVANNELFNAGLILGTDSTAQAYNISNNSLTNSLTFAGNISGGVTGGTAATETLNVGGAGNTVIGGSLLNGGGGQTLALTKFGTGTLTFNGATNAALIGSGAAGGAFGTVTVNSGTLTLDYSNYSAVGNANLLNSYTPVTLAGGTLQMIGNATNASTQSFNNGAGVTVNSGFNVISVGPNGGNLANPLPTLNLGAFTQNVGSQTVFNGPAYNSSASNAAGVTVPATGTITTTTLGNQNKLLWPTSRAGIATVGLYNWASVVTTPAGTNSILSGDQVSGFYAQVAAGGSAVAADTNYDLLGNATAASTTTWYTDTLRFNVPGAFSFSTTSAGTNHITLIGGILVTPNVGANNTTIANGGSYIASADSTAGNCPIDVYQNNTAGELLINSPFYYYSSTSRATCFVQGGAGTVNLTGQTTLDTNYGATYLNGGTTIISDNSQLGRTATNATLNLNGGTVAGSINGLSLGTRPVTLGGNGGGLSAFTGTQMNVSGFISGAVGTGSLVIGIPASAANGNNTSGLVPGTGTGTANAANYAAGTVVLNASAGNGYYGGTTILGGATLNINSEYQLGGADQGPVTFNNGTLQYAGTLLNAVTDISQNTGGIAQTVTFAAGGGTIDTNGHAIVYANPIGGGGSGGFTLTDSQAIAANRGSLTLNGSNTYTGPTTISAGKLILSSGASLASSGVTVSSGATLLAMGTSSAGPGRLMLSSGSSLSLVDNAVGTLNVGSLTTSANSVLSYEFGASTNDQITTTTNGGLTLNGGTFNLSNASSSGAVPLTTDGTYTLINYVGSDTIAGGSSAINSDLSVGNPVYGLHYAFHDTGSGAIQLLVTGTAATSSGWILDGSGSWATAADWSSSAIPNSVGSFATFAGGASTHANLTRAVTLDGSKTIGTMLFDSPNGESYTISQGTGGSLNFNTGTSSMATITVNAGSHSISAPVTLSNSLDITTTGTSNLAISGNISNATGTNTLTKDGTGKLVLSGTNTFGPAAGTIGTTINAGTVQVGSSSALSTGDVSITAPVNPVTLQAGAGVTVANNINVSSGITFTLDTQGYPVVLSGVVSGVGSGITKIGNASLIITGSNTYTGTTNVSAGTLQLGNGGTSGYLSGNIINNSALVLDRTDNYALGNSISGTGTLTQVGSDAVTLNGANTFAGNTVINSASLITGNALALQDSTLNYNNQGGTLSFGTLTAATIGGLVGSQNLPLVNASAAPVALTFGGSGTNLYTGTLIGTGGASLTMTATGTQTIGSGAVGGANYSGGTTVNSGTLVLGGTTNISDGVIGLTGLNGASTLTIADSAQVNSSSILYLEDLPVYQGATQYFPASSNLIVKGNSQLTVPGLSIGLPAGTRVVSSTVTVQDTATLTVNGGFNLESTAGGTASTNVVNLNGGTLAVQNFSFTGGGSGSGTTQLANIQFNGGVLKSLASDTSTALFVPATTGINTLVQVGGAIVNTNSYNDTIATPLVHGSGATADGGLTKTGTGVLTLTANATYNGPTVISGGTLRLGVQGTLVASYSFDNPTNTPVGSLSQGSTVVNAGSGGSTMNGVVEDGYGNNNVNIVAGGPKINGNNGNGNSLQFTGDDSTVLIGSGIENLSGGGSWTVSSWIQTTQPGATILGKNSGGYQGTWSAGNSIFYLSNGSGGTANTTSGAGVIPSAARSNAGYETAATTANVADGNWHMVTYVDNAGTKSIYIDGVLSALSQNGLGTSTDVGSQVQLGYPVDTTTSDGAQALSGNLDDINFFSSALTASQIQSLMNTNSAYGNNPNAGVNTLLPTTTVNINTAGASLDVDGTSQTVASLAGVAGSTVTLGGGTLTVGNGANTSFAGNISDTGGASALTGGQLVKQGAGSLTLTGSNSYSGGTFVTAGTLVLGSSNALPTNTGLNVSSGAFVTVANHSTNSTFVPVLSSLGNSGTIDLVNNAMLIHGGAIGTISAEVAAGYNNGAWNGTSGSIGVITSSLAAADSTHLTAVGVATGITGTFEGLSVTSSDVLVKYTYYGDTNLDGKVDGSDYSRIDNAYLYNQTASSPLTGWFNGDFNFDGVINGSDYTLIDNAFNTQGADIAAEIASPSAVATALIAGAGTSAVPEPTTLGLLGIGAAGLLGRRRRK